MIINIKEHYQRNRSFMKKIWWNLILNLWRMIKFGHLNLQTAFIFQLDLQLHKTFLKKIGFRKEKIYILHKTAFL